jgi:hypothetical protein
MEDQFCNNKAHSSLTPNLFMDPILCQVMLVRIENVDKQEEKTILERLGSII